MSNVTIDVDILTAALTQAIKVAVEASGKPKEVEAKPKPNRGRPAKNKITKEQLSSDNTEIITVEEEVLSIKDDKARTPNQKNTHLFAAKKISNAGVSNKQVTESVLDNRREQKFIDIANVPHEKQDWQPTERRPAAQLLDFVCTNCNQPFKDYASNVQQAFFRVAGSDMPDSQERCAVIKCPKCSTR